jgi:hypothetical protein
VAANLVADQEENDPLTLSTQANGVPCGTDIEFDDMPISANFEYEHILFIQAPFGAFGKDRKCASQHIDQLVRFTGLITSELRASRSLRAEALSS